MAPDQNLQKATMNSTDANVDGDSRAARTMDELADGLADLMNSADEISLPTLQGMPCEIIIKIMKFSTNVATTCLSLTCTKLYAITLPHLTTAKVALLDCGCGQNPLVHTHDTVRYRHHLLHSLIGNWMGTDYHFRKWYRDRRRLREPFGRFLNRNFYPEPIRDAPCHVNDEAFEGLVERYTDFFMVGSYDSVMKKWDSKLPNPFGLGQEWYVRAEEVVIASLEASSEHDEPSDCFHAMVVIWEKTNVFKRERVQSAIEDCQWKMWSEGMALMDF